MPHLLFNQLFCVTNCLRDPGQPARVGSMGWVAGQTHSLVGPDECKLISVPTFSFNPSAKAIFLNSSSSMAKLPKYPALLPEDPVAAPLRRPRPPKGIATNPALCKQCNASLQLDDKFLTPKLKKSTDGEPYLDGIKGYGRGIFAHAPHSVFGGIDYATGGTFIHCAIYR